MAQRVELHASAARTSTATGSALPLVYVSGEASFLYSEIVFELDVTAAAAVAGDEIDIFVQTKFGIKWIDVVHFTKVIGTDTTKTFIAKIVSGIAESMYELSSALAAGSERNIIGPKFRARWVVVSASAPSFTFTVNATGIAR